MYVPTSPLREFAQSFELLGMIWLAIFVGCCIASLFNESPRHERAIWYSLSNFIVSFGIGALALAIHVVGGTLLAWPIMAIVNVIVQVLVVIDGFLKPYSIEEVHRM